MAHAARVPFPRLHVFPHLSLFPLFSVWLAAATLVAAGCNTQSKGQSSLAGTSHQASSTAAASGHDADAASSADELPLTSETLTTFASDKELRAYVAKIDKAYLEQDSDGESDKSDESITNTQEAGVDEGGIVKVHGEHLVVLRRGRLFTVRIADRALRPVSMLDVIPPGGSTDTWYDEMLIHDDTIVVIGYSYGAEGTEIGLFGIDSAGVLRYRDTFYLRSNDYYSSRNYASRLVGDKLVFYMPYALAQQRWDDGKMTMAMSLPGIRRRALESWDDILTAQQIYQPIQPVSWPFLHTVVSCDLGRPRLACTAQSIIGPYSHSFYVSSSAVYIWVSSGNEAAAMAYDDGGGEDGFAGGAAAKTTITAGVPNNAVIYRMPLDGSAPGALRAWGTPTDQFSFKEDRDGQLAVLVRAYGGGEGMWGAETSDGDVVLLRVPVAAFATQVQVADRVRYTSLPRPQRGYSLQNRFVGDYVLYGTGSSWGWYDPEHDPHVYLHRYRALAGQAGITTALELPHGVDRIEAMGPNAVVIGSDGKNLHFSAVALGSVPSVAGRYSQKNASQGETRSHGFFYKPEGQGKGILGLPIRRDDQPGYAQLVAGSAAVVFLRVDDLAFRPLGKLAARATSTNDHCRASCVDWYGNARPIFLKGRVFALLGYELVEGRVAGDNRIMEVARTNFYTAQRRRR